MRLQRLIFSVIVLLAVFVFAVPATAQDTIDSELLDYVASAFDSTLAVSSLSVETRSATEIAGIPNLTEPIIEQTQSFQIVRTENGINATGSLTTISLIGSMMMGGQPQEGTPTASTTTMEVILLDGETYIRFTELPVDLAGTLPEEWIGGEQFAELAQSMTSENPFQGGVTGTEFLNSDTLDATLLGTLSLPINSATVTAVSELDTDTIEDQPMGVFQLTLDAQILMESGATGLFNAGFGGGPGGTPPDVTPPAEMSGTFPAPMDVTQNAEIVIAVWMGDEDQLVHRIYSVIAIAPDENDANAMPFSLTITSISDFSNFNEPVEITAPN